MTPGAVPEAPDPALRRRLLAERRYEELARLQARALRAHPDDPALHHQMAWVCAAQRSFADAARHERRALKLAPTEARYARALARYLSRTGDEAAAARAEARATQLEAERAERFASEQGRHRERVAAAVASGVSLVVGVSGRFADIGQLDRSARVLDPGRPLDTVAGWAKAVTPVHREGEVAEIPGVGRLRVGPHDQVLHKRLARGMAWEAPVAALVAELAARCDPGAVMVEVGANVGAHTVVMAREHRGTVLAFEPVPETFDRLEDNLRLNAISNVVARRQACSSAPGRGSMGGAPAHNPGMSRLSVGDAGDTEVTTLDAAAAELGRPVAFIKLDVEGHEAEALGGARELLERDRPVILCELLRDASTSAVELLEGLGYRAHPFFRADRLFVPAERGTG